MNDMEFTRLLAYSESVLREKAVQTLRPMSTELLARIFSNQLIFGITGLRGVGKSSLLIHALKRADKGIYISAELLLKYGYDLYEALNYAYAQGFRIFGIDEIQVLKNWPADLKLFYDESRTKIVLTGSSAIEVGVKSSELARRICLEELRPFSFREYIYFKNATLLEKKTLDKIIGDRPALAREIAPYITLYAEYLAYNALPAAFFEGRDVYKGIIERTVYHDLLPLKSIDVSYIDSSFKLLKFLASSKPGEVSYNSIANSIDRSVKFTIELVRLLSVSGILTIVPPYGKGHKAIRGENKILLPLSFRNALGDYFGVPVEKGALREDFFIHHVKNATYLRETGKRVPDYNVGGYIFEIGGESKGYSQLRGMENAYIAKESLSLTQKEIPLYLFGLLF